MKRKTYTVDACTLRGYVLQDGERIWICDNYSRVSKYDAQVETILHQFIGRYVAVEIRYTGPPIDEDLEEGEQDE